MGHFIPAREQLHSNILGSNVQIADSLTTGRLKGVTHAFSPYSTGMTATGRAGEVLSLQVRRQAFPLAISNSLLLVPMCGVRCALLGSGGMHDQSSYSIQTDRWSLTGNQLNHGAS